MPKLSAADKEQIRSLSKKDLEDIVIRLAASRDNYDYLEVNYLNREEGTRDLFERTKVEIDLLCTKRFRGYSEQLQVANLLSACTKKVNEFAKAANDKNLEADLILHVLEIPFSYGDKMFGTCFTQFDHRTTMLLKRLITLVTKKMHEDYRMDYLPRINEYLARLRRTSKHFDFVYDLPESIKD